MFGGAEVRATHPALRYYGGKWRIANWVIKHFPAHTCYCEPFGGGASVLLRKEQVAFEVYNDLDKGVCTFFRMLRERPDELIRAIELTPYSREEYERAYDHTDDPLEQARRLFVRSWQGYGGPRHRSMTGWKVQKRSWHSGRADQLSEWQHAKDLWRTVERLERVQLENDQALKVIRRFDGPETLFYCDPPYPSETRNARWCKISYQHEITGQDHYHLANVLKKIDGYAVISSYPNAAYDELFVDWHRAERRANTMNGTSAREVLFVSPRTAGALGL